ncbi:MAG: hypothetical protein Kow0037_14280 [Calditrichia bacterium]
MANQYYLTFSVPAWWALLVGLAVVLITVVYYRKTRPSLPRGKRQFLLILRSAALILISLVLLKPQWLVLHQQTVPPKVALLLDNSDSMTIPEENGRRGDSLQWALSRIREWPDSDSLERRLFTFSDSLRPLAADTLTFDGFQSDISLALQSVRELFRDRNLKSIFLFSDGRVTKGETPALTAAKSTVPINTVLIGSPQPVPDLQVTSVTSERVVTQGDTVVVLIKLVHRGLEGQLATIRLEGDQKERKIKKVKLGRSGFEQDVQFEYLAGKPGDHLLKVIASVPQSELNSENNQRHFYLKVLRQQQRVLLISGQANFDQHALSYVLNKMPKTSFNHITEIGAGKFIPGNWQKELKDSLDAVLLLGFPTRRTPANIWQNISRKILKERIPVWVFLNRNTDWNRLSVLSEQLPASIKGSAALRGEGEVRLTFEGEWHPATRLSDDQTETIALWKSLPPIEFSGLECTPEKGAVVLLEAASPGSANSHPLLLVQKKGYSKSLLFGAGNFYRWHLPLQTVAGKQAFFQQWISQSLRWLMNREDLNPVQIFPERQIYSVGEDVVFTGNVLDEFYRARNDAEVRIELRSGSEQIADIFRNEAGRYRFRWHFPLPGEYEYRIAASLGEREIGVTSGKVYIAETNPEQINPDTDPEMLMEIARKSGGEFLTVQQALRKLENLNYSGKIRRWEEEVPLWHHPAVLAFIISLLAVEWFFRKRWGLL